MRQAQASLSAGRAAAVAVVACTLLVAAPADVARSPVAPQDHALYLPAPAVYLVAASAEGTSAPSGIWLAGLAATFAALAVVSVALSAHGVQEPA